MDWQTCTFRVFNSAPTAPATFATGISNGLKRSCEHLRAAEFRSPRLWVDSRWSPRARAAHLVEGTGPNDRDVVHAARGRRGVLDGRSHRRADAEPGAALFQLERMDVLDPAEGLVVRQRDDPRALPRRPGRVRLPRPLVAGWRLVRHVAMGSPRGRRLSSPELPVEPERNLLWRREREGARAPGDARPDHPLELLRGGVRPAGLLRLGREALHQRGPPDLRWLFQHLSDQTEASSASRMSSTTRSTARQWTSTTRPPTDSRSRALRGVRLDRAYRHDTPAILRPADESLKTNSLDPALFQAVPRGTRTRPRPSS